MFNLSAKASPFIWLALFMWSLEYSKIVHYQHGFYKESSKINASHMVHTHNPLILQDFTHI